MNPSNQISTKLPHLLVIASLFKGQFSIDWLVELTEMKSTQILLAMEEGIRQRYLTSELPGFYCFENLKKQKIFKDLLNVEEKVQWYRQIAELLLRELPDDDEKPLAVLHYIIHLPNDQEKCFWLMKAGDANLKKFRTEEALQCYTKALDGLADLSSEEADSLFCQIAIKHSKFSMARYDTTKVFSMLREALVRAKRWNKQTYLALIKMHLAKNEWLLSRYSDALKHFEQGWSIAEKLKETNLLRTATTFSTFFHYWQGRFREVIRSYERSVSDMEKYPQGSFPLWAALIVGRCYTHVGQVTQGLGMLDAIRSFTLGKGDQYTTATAHYTMGATMVDIRRMEEALRYLESSMTEARKEKNRFVEMLGKLMLAYVYYLNEEKQKCVFYLQKYLEHSRQVHISVVIYPYLMELCWAILQGELPPIQGLSLEKEVRRMKNVNNLFLKGVAYRYEALLKRRRGRSHEEIIPSLKLSLELLERSGHQVELAKSRFELAREYLLLGDEGKAQEEVQVASHILTPFNDSILPDDLKALVKGPSHPETLLKEILNLAQEVVTLRDHKGLFQHIISAANRITGSERGAIFLLENISHSAKVQLRASKNLTSEQVNHSSFASFMKMIEKVALTGKGQIMGFDKERDPGAASSAIIRSCIGVPMILGDKVVGVLYHDNRLLSSVFKESDLELLAFFAAQAAIALDNARAYSEIERLNQKLSEEKQYYQEQHLQNLDFEDIVGDSPAIMQVLEKVNQVAETDTAVLIFGETGVGKELVARAIHQKSHRKDKPFIKVLCSALPETLIPSELFGHEKGAFTGAISRRIGRFELADGGTIFLDEIGDLPLEVQVRLLRILQSKEFERVGGMETLRSDFRLVVTTNRDLEQEVKAGRFRPDLYYRLNVFPIPVPPLKERKEDIPFLAQYFLKIYSTKMGKTFKGFLERDMNKLIQYDWPGNIRELENIIERGTILSTGPDFRLPELSFGEPEMVHSKANLTLKENERRHILWALKKTGWKVRGKDGAAELLDLPPSTLAFRMKKLGIQRAPKFSPREMIFNNPIS